MSLKYHLSIGSIFKNESHILNEWIDYYILMGVDHFYLVNNNSRDNFLEKVEKYRSIVSLYNDNRNYSQIEIYNELILPIAKQETKWLLIIDFDEFVFNPNGLRFKDILMNYDDFGGVGVPWIFFGSNGYIKQPSNVIQSFTTRKYYNKGILVNVKNFYNIRYINKLYIHHADINDNILVSCKNRQIIENGQELVCENDIIKKRYDFLINHYAIQSLDFFTNIKMTRGDILNPKLDKLRDNNYFKMYDTNDIVDTTLSDILNNFKHLKTNISQVDLIFDGIVVYDKYNQQYIDIIKKNIKSNYICVEFANTSYLKSNKYYFIENINKFSPMEIRNISIKYQKAWLIVLSDDNNPKIDFILKLFNNKLILTSSYFNSTSHNIHLIISKFISF